MPVNSKKARRQEPVDANLPFVASIIGLFAISWCLTAAMVPMFTGAGFFLSLSEAAEWGESFGGLSSLFSAFGFAAVVWTLLLQMRQNRSAEADQHRQRFESHYIELLKLLREARDDVRFRHDDEYKRAKGINNRRGYVGIDAFRQAWTMVNYYINAESSKEEIAEIYESRIHKRFENNFGPYFRLVYTILKGIKDDAYLDEDEKARYGNLLRSQLTSFEVALHGLNGLSGISKDFGELICEFHLLKYLPEGGRRIVLSKCYPKSAFASRDDGDELFSSGRPNL